MFRGQSVATWELKPSLERVTTLQVEGGGELRMLAPMERNLIQRFQQMAHQFLDVIPGDDDILDWLALLQHYGAPTRLLDWTASPYVAAYFALESAEEGEECAVWGVRARWLYRAAYEILSKADQTFPKIPRPDDWRQYVNKRLSNVQWSEYTGPRDFGEDVVLRVHPRRLDERMAVFCAL